MFRLTEYQEVETLFMEIEIIEFRKRLEAEIAKGNPNIAEFIIKEIRLSENMKASLMEEMKEETKEFLNAAAAKFDTYIFQLQEIEKEMGLTNLSLDQKTALNDTLLRNEISNKIEELSQSDDIEDPVSDK